MSFSKAVIVEEFSMSILESANKDNCQKFILLTNSSNPEAYAISPEKVIRSYNDFPNYQFSFEQVEKEPLHIACFFPETSSDPRFIFQAISVINKLPNSRFSFYLSARNCEIFSPYCNDHIKIIPLDTESNISISANLVITYGLNAIHFLRNKIPVLILGPHGIGGLVTPFNIGFLYKTGFMGRPGGGENERVLVELVAHEIGLLKDEKDIPRFLNENRVLADDLPINPLSKEILIQGEFINKIGGSYNNQSGRWELKPKLCSNMHISYLGDQLHIKRAYTSDTICTTGNEDAAFFMDLNGENTCRYLKEKYKMEEEEFWDGIDMLIKNQIILFGV